VMDSAERKTSSTQTSTMVSSNGRGMEATSEDPGDPTSCCTIGGGANSPTRLLYLGHN
jgi:hypothetical protein